LREVELLDTFGAATIDFTETAYDLSLGRTEWLPCLLEAGRHFLDQGLGVAGVTFSRDAEGRTFEMHEVHVTGCQEDFVVRLARASGDAPEGFLWKVSRPTVPMTLSEASVGEEAGFERVMRHFSHANDGLGISACDPDGQGVYLIAPLVERTSLTSRERERWQMVAAHFGAGNRLRRALAQDDIGCEEAIGQAEAILDANNLRIEEAKGSASGADALEKLRAAAKCVDRARGRLRRTDPEAALQIWDALVRGRWSMVDWFDSDDRRYLLAIPNSPNVDDPRGLTHQEACVVSYVVSGHTNKLIGYQLGLSKARVSTLVQSAMRKLDVRTRPQLVKKWRDLGGFRAVRSRPPTAV